jgi:Family of unknown function (DUF6148)
MSAFTLEQAQTQLAAWMAANLALSTGAQEYSIGGRAFRKADLGQVAAQILYWQRMVDRLLRNPVGARIRTVIPL